MAQLPTSTVPATHSRFARLVAGAALALTCMLATACSKEPSRWDKAAEAAKTAADLPKAAVADGAKLNKFFPPKEFDGKKYTFTAEKDGYAEAKLEDSSGELGTITVSDVAGTPESVAKFDSATDKVLTFPLTTTGKNKSSALVGKRFQIAVMSTKLDADARKAVIAKFDLTGLAAFNPPAAK